MAISPSCVASRTPSPLPASGSEKEKLIRCGLGKTMLTVPSEFSRSEMLSMTPLPVPVSCGMASFTSISLRVSVSPDMFSLAVISYPMPER